MVDKLWYLAPSIVQLAHQLGLAVAGISNIRAGVRSVPLPSLTRLSSILTDIGVEYIGIGQIIGLIWTMGSVSVDPYSSYVFLSFSPFPIKCLLRYSTFNI